MRRTLSLLACCTALACAQDTAKLLAPSGTLRVTFLGNNPVQGKVDAKSGAISGPVRELTEALAKRLGVPFEITPAAGVRAAMDRLLAHQSDLGFLAVDPSRAAELDFTEPYLLAWNTYLVRADSSIQRVADADRAGARIAVVQGDSADLYLTRNLKNGVLKRLPSAAMAEVGRLLREGEIDAFATNRERLADWTQSLPGTRLAGDDIFPVPQALALPKGDAARVTMLNDFLAEARRSGLVAGAIQRAGLRGAEVAK
jgi:polar amino acid transport system substrate-binding protein